MTHGRITHASDADLDSLIVPLSRLLLTPPLSVRADDCPPWLDPKRDVDWRKETVRELAGTHLLDLLASGIKSLRLISYFYYHFYYY